MAAIDSFLTSITNFFGVAEVNYDDGDIQAEGLSDSDEYLYNENGDEMTHEELVEKLKSSDRCKANFLTSIGDFFEGGNFRDECSFLRYIQNESKGKDVDMGLVISTIFYGYEYQPSYSQYDTGVTPE